MSDQAKRDATRLEAYRFVLDASRGRRDGYDPHVLSTPVMLEVLRIEKQLEAATEALRVSLLSSAN